MKKAFITGVTGQDGSYLAELLLEKNYEVHAITRRSSVFTTQRVDHLLDHPQMKTYHGDLADSSNLHSLLSRIEPDEIYNLGAQSHVRVSFDCPEFTYNVTGLGTVRLLEAIRDVGIKPRYYQAGSSEMFGGCDKYQTPLNEDSKFSPKSPYAVAKVMAHMAVVNYRESYGLHACNGILFNHESPRRGETFVTRKITKAAAMISAGLQKELLLGNIEAKRDWGYAGDYVDAMWLMLQKGTPGDYVIGTGECYSVKDFLTEAFGAFSLDWREHVKIDPVYFRPSEVDVLLSDSSKARTLLGWKPSVDFRQLVRMMCQHDAVAVSQLARQT